MPCLTTCSAPGRSLDALKAQILRHTGQVPLFIEEVARQLLNRGVLDADAGRFAARTPWEALEIPPTVQGVIASRIDRLPKEDKALLQLASVVGPRIPPPLLTAVTGMPAAELQSRLWSLEILDFLVESRWLAAPEYEFAHDLIREVAYDSILRPQREELHRRILAALEANALGHQEEVAEALCHHAVKAQDWAKADQYGYMAAKKALARSAFRDATEYFQIAMDAVDKQPASTAREQRAIDLRIEARLAFAPLGSMEQWFGLCRDAEARSEKIGDEQRRLASIVVKAVALNFYGTPYEAITAAEQAVALANSLAATRLARLCRVWARSGLFHRRPISGRRAALKPGECAVCQRTGKRSAGNDRIEPSRALSYDESDRLRVDWASSTIPSNAPSRQAISPKSNDRPYDIIAARYGRGLVQLVHGNLEEAESALDEAAFLSRENEVRLFLPLVLCALGNLHLQQGRAAEAKRHPA